MDTTLQLCYDSTVRSGDGEPTTRHTRGDLGRALGALRLHSAQTRAAGCRRSYIDGSFVTAKEAPGDFDGCWEVAGVDPDLLDPVLLNFANRRAAQKAKYGGELFPAEGSADPFGTRFLDFFQRDKDTADPKGIVGIDLGGLP